MLVSRVPLTVGQLTVAASRLAASARYSLVLLLLGLISQHACQAHTLKSPNGLIEVNVGLSQSDDVSRIEYAVAFNGERVIERSGIGFVSHDGERIGDNLRAAQEPEFSKHDSTWKPVYGERSKIHDRYNQLRLSCVDEASGMPFGVEFRCYDSGVAFRTTLEGPDTDPRIHIEEERSEFRFLGDHTAWCARRAQDRYQVRRLSDLGDRVERPLTIKVNDGLYAAIAEAGLVDYATMQLRGSERDPHCVVSKLGGGVQADGQLTTPWRVVMLGRSPGELLQSNDIILNLSEPCAIADTSWIKPGKVIREITLTTEGGKKCIDFAAANNFQYIEFDAGWYGHEYSDTSDATTVTLDKKRSSGPLDLHEVIAYGKERGIGVIVYVNRRALETQLDEILPLYQQWGLAGVKYGFVNTESQHWTAWLHEAIRKAAEHKLMVDVHDEYRPTGYSRTYPNFMSQEGVCGDEASPSSRTALTTLFTRNLAGAADHTICYFDSRVDRLWTHAHQLGKAVCTYSPWQFIYWYDTPLPSEPNSDNWSHIVDTLELEFFRRVPTVWDDTSVLHCEIGHYAVVARRSGQDWFIGAMNNQQPRELTVPLDFLPSGRDFTARVYSDDPSVATVTHVRVDEQQVDSSHELTMTLAANGGQAVWLRAGDASGVASHPKDLSRSASTTVPDTYTE